VALLVRLTVREPQRGDSERAPVLSRQAGAPPIRDALLYLWQRPSFRHMSLAAALHSVAWYAGSAFNNSFFIRVHHMSTGEAGSWVALLLAVGGIGTLLGGYFADSLSVARADRRWYMWVPGYATLAMVPFQFAGYLASTLWVAVPSFSVML